jgi:hypothetical protein
LIQLLDSVDETKRLNDVHTSVEIVEYEKLKVAGY